MFDMNQFQNVIIGVTSYNGYKPRSTYSVTDISSLCHSCALVRARVTGHVLLGPRSGDSEPRRSSCGTSSASPPQGQRLAGGEESEAAREAAETCLDPPLPPPSMPADATQATQVDDDHDHDSAGSLEHADDPAPAQAPRAL